MVNESMDRITAAASYIKSRAEGKIPEVGVVLGSGLGKLGDAIEDRVEIPYEDIPFFMKPTAMGHKGNFIIGTLAGKTVCAMQGRFHYYEGYSMEQVTLPVRVMITLGIKYFFVCNAAGGVCPSYKVGDIMIITDHINLLPNPLIGTNLDEMGPRFPDMTYPYDPVLIKKAEAIADNLSIPIKKGVYIAGTGPSYETQAEYKFFRMIGADAVGMSTVPEVIVARHHGTPVFGVSVITNAAYDFTPDSFNDFDDVLSVADMASDRLLNIFYGLISSL